MIRIRSLLPVVPALLLLAGFRPASGAPPASPSFDPAFWATWGDGQAELSGYRLTEPRYGHPRTGTAVLIFVTETFADGPRVKSDPGRRPAAEEFPVMKLNRIEDFQTGIYDYNVMTSIFVALTGVHGRPAGSPTRVSFSSQEWCGHVYSQALFDQAGIRFTSHSYFDGEADEERTLPGEVPLAEDGLILWARGMTFPRLERGESRSVELLRSLKTARLNHRPLESTTATLSVEKGTKRLTVPAGAFEVETRLARLADGRTWTFDVEAAAPRRLIRWSNSDGEEALYLAGDRMKYWEMNNPGGEAELKRVLPN